MSCKHEWATAIEEFEVGHEQEYEYCTKCPAVRKLGSVTIHIKHESSEHTVPVNIK
jgi:hypothetical protein